MNDGVIDIFLNLLHGFIIYYFVSETFMGEGS